MAPRKTVHFDELRRTVNSMLAKSIDEAKQQRQGMFAVLERVLLDTDNYRGFQYLDSEFEGEGTDRKLRDGFDDTRRRYY